jgi:hypothetical protein
MVAGARDCPADHSAALLSLCSVVLAYSCKSKATQISRVAFVIPKISVANVHYAIALYEGSRGCSWQQ